MTMLRWCAHLGAPLVLCALQACSGTVSSPGGNAPGGGAGPGPGSGGSGGEPVGPPPPPPYEALAPSAYAAKVKDALTGMALTDDELLAVTMGGRGALVPLIDGWMETPQFRDRMFDFFKRSFQQTQLDVSDLDDQLRLASANVNRTDQQRILRAVEESFARTVLAMMDERRPFTETVTTTRFMVNVPLMVALSYMDAAPRNDTGRQVPAGFWIMQKFGGDKVFQFKQVTGADPVTGVVTPIPLEQTIDPASPNFMSWTFAQPDPARYPPCVEPVVVTGTRAIERAFGALFGSRDACQGAPAAPTFFTDADWNSWRMVEIRPPRAGEERTIFWDLPRLRDPATKELVLAMPRVGFMTTLAFFANWPTNPSNSYRVTTNQALIVALGRSFDDRSTLVQVSETSVDAMHIDPGTVCYACHQVLDPMRDFFKQTYSLTYFQQLDLANKRNPLPAQATFILDGSTPVVGSGVPAFARAVADHPYFPRAWAQKLCHFANASACLDHDPELLRVSEAFRASNFDWKVLVREMFSSPLVTYAASTKTAETKGVTIGIARREALCARLSTRLKTADVCNLDGQFGLPKNLAGSATNLSQGIAGSTYARADVEAVMPHDPNLFFASATEKLCMLLAGQLVETASAPWKVATLTASLRDFVHVVMGVPPADPRAALLLPVLERHYQAALTAKEKQVDALRSAFVLACSSPLTVSSGL
jgi:hypothetical protein